MKFVIEKVRLIEGAKPTVMISWASGTTDFYPWHSYPQLPDLAEFKPWFNHNTPGLTLFRAPTAMPPQEVKTHNIRHYQSDPGQPPIYELVPRLEKAADEIEEISKSHCLYFGKKEMKGQDSRLFKPISPSSSSSIPPIEQTTEDDARKLGHSPIIPS